MALVEDTNQTETHVKLPLGYQDREGNWHRYADIREMTGRDEEALADPRNRNNAAKAMTKFLASCVTKIGSISPVTEEIIRDMSIGDRDFLMVKIRQLSFGNKVKIDSTCPNCSAKLGLTVNLDELEIKNPIGEDEEPTLTHTISLPKGVEIEGRLYKEAVIRTLTGADLEFVLQDKYRQNPVLMVSATILKNLVSIGPKRTFTMEDVRNLSSADRRAIGEQAGKKMPALDMEVHITCSVCNHEFSTTMDAKDFFSMS
jgi:hypothetical protein